MGLESLIVASSLWLFGKHQSKFVDGLLNFIKQSGFNTSDIAKWAKYGWTSSPIKIRQQSARVVRQASHAWSI
jgi:hypothetical protein